MTQTLPGIDALAADLAAAADVPAPAVVGGAPAALSIGGAAGRAVITLPAGHTREGLAGVLAHEVAHLAERVHGHRPGLWDRVRSGCVAVSAAGIAWALTTAVMDSGPAAWLSVLAAAAGGVAIWFARRGQEDAEQRRADATATALLDACGHDGPACTRAALTEALEDAEDDRAPRWDRWELRHRLAAAERTKKES